ncbi:hypothetical protein EVAR_10011_1 [Eumeta japonica]|uniref:Uncharacterized protein n=1 Tax=Eumeta variegata TaxID=151549 RepID=A0A4C1TR12_EUMVA|nr:hypothetical protein EVAR_10011_1 [Eumeta japonica]
MGGRKRFRAFTHPLPVVDHERLRGASRGRGRRPEAGNESTAPPVAECGRIKVGAGSAANYQLPNTHLAKQASAALYPLPKDCRPGSRVMVNSAAAREWAGSAGAISYSHRIQ